LNKQKKKLEKKKVSDAMKFIERRRNKRDPNSSLKKHGSVLNLNDLEKLENSNLLYGMDLETKLKRDEQYTTEWAEKEIEVLNWIESVTQEEVDHLYLFLKSGRVLCKLMNIIQPGIITKINDQKVVFYERENIQNFCNAVMIIGLPQSDVFSVESLYEAKDLISVIRTLLALKRKATTYKKRPSADIKEKKNEEQTSTFTWSDLLIPLVVGVGGAGVSLLAGMAAPIGIGVGVIGAGIAGVTKYWFGY